jgi:antitoxin MazE
VSPLAGRHSIGYTLYSQRGGAMETRLMKWGNSQGIRLPKAVLEEARLKSGDRLSITVQDGAIVIAPARGRPTLQALLDRVRPANLHGELPTGPAEGREEW